MNTYSHISEQSCLIIGISISFEVTVIRIYAIILQFYNMVFFVKWGLASGKTAV